MKKPVFTWEEARSVGWADPPNTLKLQLHQWTRAGDLVRLKKGVYGFPGEMNDNAEIAQALYSPCYISLEYALQYYGLIPEAVFAVTLVTPKGTKDFKTPAGHFIYHKIRQDFFWGYDPDTLIGEREKILVDYLYLKSGSLYPKNDFWQELRLQYLDEVDFEKAEGIAKKLNSKKVSRLLKSLKEYAELEWKS